MYLQAKQVPDRIVMLSNSRIKHIQSLKMKKFREESGEFVAEGHKLVTDLADSPFPVMGIYASKAWIAENEGFLNSRELQATEISDREMIRITLLTSPSPVLGVFGIPEPGGQPIPSVDSPDTLYLALDDIRDPGNMGTIIRIADWFGISTIFCSETCVDQFNPKVVQATMGSIARVEIIRTNLEKLLGAFVGQGTEIYGAVLEGKPLHELPAFRGGILLIGNESKGISPEAAACITKRVSIPSYGNAHRGKAESLNASVAAAIFVSEFRRPFTGKPGSKI